MKAREIVKFVSRVCVCVFAPRVKGFVSFCGVSNDEEGRVAFIACVKSYADAKRVFDEMDVLVGCVEVAVETISSRIPSFIRERMTF